MLATAASRLSYVPRDQSIFSMTNLFQITAVVNKHVNCSNLCCLSSKTRQCSAVSGRSGNVHDCGVSHLHLEAEKKHVSFMHNFHYSSETGKISRISQSHVIYSSIRYRDTQGRGPSYYYYYFFRPTSTKPQA